MSTVFKSSLIMMCFISLSNSAMASSETANNVITFRGEITNRTCSVMVNGNAGKPLVLLPTVSVSSFDSGVKVAGQTKFDISLTDCAISDDEVKVSTVFVGNNVTNSGNLGNTGSAQNVEIQILDPHDNVINLSNEYNNNNDLNVAARKTTSTASYTAQYYASGVASVGTVQSTLQYAISYQ